MKPIVVTVLCFSLVVLTVIFLGDGNLVACFWSNWAMVSLNHSLITFPDTSATQAVYAEGLLRKAVAAAPKDRSNWWGLGYVLAAQGREDESIAAWRTAGAEADEFILRAQHAQEAGQYEKALRWLEIAVMINPNKGWSHYAVLSQYLIEKAPDRFDYLEENYEKYVKWNRGNWIIDSEFESGGLGWSSYRPSGEGAMFGLDDTEGPMSAFVVGMTDKYHGGWLQRLRLSEGTLYKYSAHIRMRDVDNLQVEALYWESYGVDGEPRGHSSGQVLSGNMDWTYFELDLRAPYSEKGIALYPVLVSGRGRVWIDSVQLVVLSEGGK